MNDAIFAVTGASLRYLEREMQEAIKHGDLEAIIDIENLIEYVKRIDEQEAMNEESQATRR